VFRARVLQRKIDDTIRLHLPYNLWEYELGEDYDDDEEEKTILCQECDDMYPCRTVKILGGKW
jgi:hypothetical protein